MIGVALCYQKNKAGGAVEVKVSKKHKIEIYEVSLYCCMYGTTYYHVTDYTTAVGRVVHYQIGVLLLLCTRIIRASMIHYLMFNSSNTGQQQ